MCLYMGRIIFRVNFDILSYELIISTLTIIVRLRISIPYYDGKAKRDKHIP